MSGAVGPGHRAHGGQRRRDDVDLVAGVTHEGAHLRLGGVAPRPHGRRPHVVGRTDDLGHLATHIGARRQAAFQLEQPVELIGHPLERAAHRRQLGHGGLARLGVGHGDLGILDGDPHAPADPGGGAPAQVLGRGPPGEALPTGSHQRHGGQDAAHGHVAVQQPPVPADVAAGDKEGGDQAQCDHEPGDEEELEDVFHEGHTTNATREILESSAVPCRDGTGGLRCTGLAAGHPVHP